MAAREATAQRRPAQSKRKNAFFPRNTRPYGLNHKAFQTEYALRDGLGLPSFVSATSPGERSCAPAIRRAAALASPLRQALPPPVRRPQRVEPLTAFPDDDTSDDQRGDDPQYVQEAFPSTPQAKYGGEDGTDDEYQGGHEAKGRRQTHHIMEKGDPLPAMFRVAGRTYA